MTGIINGAKRQDSKWHDNMVAWCHAGQLAALCSITAAEHISGQSAHSAQ